MTAENTTFTGTHRGRKVPLGTPITTEQATRAVLRLIRSPIIGDIDKDSSTGYTFKRLHKPQEGTTAYDQLSGGERRLVDIAYAIWRSSDDEGASIGAIGGLDPDNRRKVIVILAYLHLGRDFIFEATEDEFGRMFDDQ